MFRVFRQYTLLILAVHRILPFFSSPFAFDVVVKNVCQLLTWSWTNTPSQRWRILYASIWHEYGQNLPVKDRECWLRASHVCVDETFLLKIANDVLKHLIWRRLSTTDLYRLFPYGLCESRPLSRIIHARAPSNNESSQIAHAMVRCLHPLTHLTFSFLACMRDVWHTACGNAACCVAIDVSKLGGRCCRWWAFAMVPLDDGFWCW